MNPSDFDIPDRSVARIRRPQRLRDGCVAVAALRRKVEVVRDPSFSTIAAAVEITSADGKVHKLSQAAARGSDVNPLDDADHGPGGCLRECRVAVQDEP